MYPITSAVKALFDAEQQQVLRITGTDRNGASIIITDADVLINGFNIDRYCCNGEKLELGTAIAAQMTLRLDNRDGRFDNVIFEGMEMFVEIGIADWTQSEPTITYIPCGYYTPDMQPRRLNHIDLTCLDRMTRFDVVVEPTDLTLPATVAGLVGQMNTLCGVTLAESIDTLPNADVVITELPTVNGDMTYRNLLQWCAGIMATNAWFDWNGLLRFTWYGTETGYETTTGNRFDSDYYEEDLTITGAVYTNSSGVEIVEGTDDYAIDLTGNALAGPLIATVLPAVNTAVNGFSYRPLTAAVVNAPYLWPMDAIDFTDKDGNTYSSVLTNVAFGLNGTTALESKGLTYTINQRAQPKGVTKEQAQLITQAMEQVETEIDESLTQEDIFNRLTDNGTSQGLFLTQDGQLYINASYIYSGLLTLGGLNNENGTMRVLDANGNEIVELRNTGINIYKGSINLPFNYGGSNGNISLGGGSYPLYATITDPNDVNWLIALSGKAFYIVDRTHSNSNNIFNNRIYIHKQNEDNEGIPRISLQDDVNGFEIDIKASNDGIIIREYSNGNWNNIAKYGYDVIVPGALSVGDAATTRTNLGITPANIRAFGQGSVSSSLTDANNTALYGSVMLNGGSCANLPSSTAGAYYMVEFFGPYQIASRHTANVGVGEVWARYYANSQWYPWVRVDGIGKATLADVVLASGSHTFSNLAAGAQTNASIAFSSSIGTTNYIVVTQSNVSRCAIGIQNRTATGFDLYCRNVSAETASPVITWAVIALG